MVLEQFSLRSGSGGSGLYRGGDGVIRKLLFRRPVVLSVLSERRSTQPYGLHGNFIYSELNGFYHSCVDTNGKMCFLVQEEQTERRDSICYIKQTTEC